MNGSSVSSPGFIAQCAGSQPCGLKMPTNLGICAEASALTEGTMAGNIDSRSGSVNVTPAPRKKVRLGICFFVINIASPSHSSRYALPSLAGISRRQFGLAIHLKRRALSNFEHDSREAVVVLRRFA